MATRFAIGLAFVLLAIAPAPAAATHGSQGFGHLNVDVAELEPGQSKSYHLDPANMEMGQDITLSQGWVFGVFGYVASGEALELRLLFDGTAVSNWTWGPGSNANTTRLRFTGEYDVNVTNVGATKAQFALYYDQSCNCAGKLIPLPGGKVVFNYDLPKGRDVTVGMPLIPAWRVKGSLATLSSTQDARWPQDFSVLSTQEARGPAWLNMTFKTDQDERYYLIVEALDGASLERPIDLTPLLTVKGRDEGIPSVDVGAAAFLVVALALAVRRRG